MSETSPVSGSTAVSAQSATIKSRGGTSFNLSLFGTWTGSVQVQRSFDAGTTWLDRGAPDTANIESVIAEPERGVSYRLDITRTTGTIDYRLGQ